MRVYRLSFTLKGLARAQEAGIPFGVWLAPTFMDMGSPTMAAETSALVGVFMVAGLLGGWAHWKRRVETDEWGIRVFDARGRRRFDAAWADVSVPEDGWQLMRLEANGTTVNLPLVSDREELFEELLRRIPRTAWKDAETRQPQANVPLATVQGKIWVGFDTLAVFSNVVLLGLLTAFVYFRAPGVKAAFGTLAELAMIGVVACLACAVHLGFIDQYRRARQSKFQLGPEGIAYQLGKDQKQIAWQDIRAVVELGRNENQKLLILTQDQSLTIPDKVQHFHVIDAQTQGRAPENAVVLKRR